MEEGAGQRRGGAAGGGFLRGATPGEGRTPLARGCAGVTAQGQRGRQPREGGARAGVGRWDAGSEVLELGGGLRRGLAARSGRWSPSALGRARRSQAAGWRHRGVAPYFPRCPARSPPGSPGSSRGRPAPARGLGRRPPGAAVPLCAAGWYSSTARRAPEPAAPLPFGLARPVRPSCWSPSVQSRRQGGFLNFFGH